MKSIEATRQEIDNHKRKSLGVRMARRVMGKYPSREDREALRRHELGPLGRIREDAFDAIRFTEKLNKTPRAVLGGGYGVLDNGTEFLPNTLRSSMTFDLNDDAKPGFRRIVTSNGLGSAVSYSFFTDKKEPGSLYVAGHKKDGHLAGQSQIDEEFVESLESSEALFLEKIAVNAANTAQWEYWQSKPENVG